MKLREKVSFDFESLTARQPKQSWKLFSLDLFFEKKEYFFEENICQKSSQWKLCSAFIKKKKKKKVHSKPAHLIVVG